MRDGVLWLRRCPSATTPSSSARRSCATPRPRPRGPLQVGALSHGVVVRGRRGLAQSAVGHVSAGSKLLKLLEPMSAICLTRHEGYWSYEFCYKKGVRQYHTVAVRDQKGAYLPHPPWRGTRRKGLSFLNGGPRGSNRPDLLQGGQ
jgi:hypothetical protein